MHLSNESPLDILASMKIFLSLVTIPIEMWWKKYSLRGDGKYIVTDVTRQFDTLVYSQWHDLTKVNS